MLYTLLYTIVYQTIEQHIGGQIDRCFNVIVMKKAQSTSSPAKNETLSSKRSSLGDSPGTTSLTSKDFADIPDCPAWTGGRPWWRFYTRNLYPRGEPLKKQQVKTLAAEKTLWDSVKSVIKKVTYHIS